MSTDAGFSRPDMSMVARRQLKLSIGMVALMAIGMIGALVTAAPTVSRSAATQTHVSSAQPG